MTKLVAMLIVCFVPDGDQLKEAWRIEKQVTLEHCLQMNQVAAGGGIAGVVYVKCSELLPLDGGKVTR